MRHRSLAALVSVLLLATQASSLAAPREDEEYSLISSDGRYLVANGDRLHLVPAEQATIGSAVHTFDFVRVPGSHELVYLRFGETILAAFDADGTSSPKFRLFTRSSPDQRVALLTSSDDVEKSKLSRCLRATPSGSVEQAAFQTSDPSVWWQLKPASARGDESCPSSPPMLGGRARAKPTNVRAASGVVSPARVITTSALTVAAATAAMLPAGVIGAAVPALAVNALGALPQPLAAAAASAGEVIKGTFGLLRQNQMAAVMAHGLLTDGISDVFAQAIAAREDGALRLDWRRARRSAAVTFVSDDLPFVLWAKFLWDAFEKLKPAIATSPLLPPWLAAALASPFGIAVLKTLASQVGYESASTAAYLGLQEAARGGGLRSVLREVRRKFWRAWTSGLAFFSITHIAMFMVPLWWMQPILDNLSCLGYNTYLAMLSYDDDANGDNTDDEEDRRLPSSGGGSGEQGNTHQKALPRT